MDRQLVEHAPDQWRGKFNGHYIEHHKPPIPVTVHVTWTDGTEGEVNGWTSQWTRVGIRRSQWWGRGGRTYWAADEVFETIQAPLGSLSNVNS